MMGLVVACIICILLSICLVLAAVLDHFRFTSFLRSFFENEAKLNEIQRKETESILRSLFEDEVDSKEKNEE